MVNGKVRTKEQLKQALGFAGFTALVPIGGAAIQQVANTPQFPRALQAPTQSILGLGLASGAIRLIRVPKKR